MITHTFMPLSDLRRCKGRTALTVLSIAIGVMLCAIVSVIGSTDATDSRIFSEITLSFGKLILLFLFDATSIP